MQIEQDGQMIEVFTPEEVEAKKQEAVAAAVAPIQKDLDAAKDQLKGLTDKDYNFATMRQKVEDLETKVKTAKEEALSEVQQGARTQLATDAITRLADGDKELKEKIEFHFARLGASAKTNDEVKKAVRDAFVLARQNEEGPDPLAGAFSSGGGAPIIPKKADPSKPALTDNQKAFLRSVYPGMTDEQIADLDSKAKPPKAAALDGNFAKRVI